MCHLLHLAMVFCIQVILVIWILLTLCSIAPSGTRINEGSTSPTTTKACTLHFMDKCAYVIWVINTYGLHHNRFHVGSLQHCHTATRGSECSITVQTQGRLNQDKQREQNLCLLACVIRGNRCVANFATSSLSSNVSDNAFHTQPLCPSKHYDDFACMSTGPQRVLIYIAPQCNRQQAQCLTCQ